MADDPYSANLPNNPQPQPSANLPKVRTGGHLANHVGAHARTNPKLLRTPGFARDAASEAFKDAARLRR
jgi:hypothetical protein